MPSLRCLSPGKDKKNDSMPENKAYDPFLDENVPPMGIYETLYAFKDTWGEFMGTEGTHPWSQVGVFQGHLGRIHGDGRDAPVESGIHGDGHGRDATVEFRGT